MHMRCGVSVAFPALLYCPTLSHNRRDFREKGIENMCVLKLRDVIPLY
jgi:hypothetical protein